MVPGLLRGIEVRAAVPADAADLARLAGQLGYPATAPEMAERLTALLRDPQGGLLVAADYGPVVGVVALHWCAMLHHPKPVARIVTLIVDEAERGRGIGRLLLKAGAQWGRQAGCDEIELTSGLHRVEAHAFYRAQGFAEKGLRLSRSLRRNRPGPGPDAD